MSNLILQAETRSKTGRPVKNLRQSNKIPAVLYGRGVKNANLSVDYVAFEKLYRSGGMSGLFELNIDEQAPLKVLLQDFQLDPLSSRFSHLDFRQVKMDEKIKTDIKLHFVNEAPAVKELGGIFVKSFSSVPVECLPQDLVPEINVDISSLKEFGQVIHIKDIIIPPGIKILAHADDVIATVTPPRAEEEAAPVAAAAPDLSQIKTEAEEKREKKAAETGEEEAAPEKKSAEKAEKKAEKKWYLRN